MLKGHLLPTTLLLSCYIASHYSNVARIIKIVKQERTKMWSTSIFLESRCHKSLHDSQAAKHLKFISFSLDLSFNILYVMMLQPSILVCCKPICNILSNYVYLKLKFKKYLLRCIRLYIYYFEFILSRNFMLIEFQLGIV